MAVAEGRYQETYVVGVDLPPPPGRWAAWSPSQPVREAPPERQPPPGPSRVGYSIVAPDGSFRQRGEGAAAGVYPADRLAAAKARLDGLPDGWQPWSLRQA